MLFKQRCKNQNFLIILIIILAVFGASCTTTGSSDQAVTSRGDLNPNPVYYAEGSGDSAIEAMNAAKRKAVKAAAADLLGEAASSGQGEELDSFINSISDFTPYIIRDSQENIDSSSSGGYYYYLGIKINLQAVAEKLKSEDILGGQIDGREGNEYSLPDQKKPSVKVADAAGVEATAEANVAEEQRVVERIIPEATAEELAVIREYLDSLTYMVYFDEESAANPFLSRTAVTSANRFLDTEGYEYVDLSQIERIKADQQLVYEEETGEAVSIIQWIAHKLNADIYIEINLDTNSSTKNGRYYGSANVALNCYNASTAEGRGSASYQTNPPAFSTVSEEDALANAVSSAVFKGMAAAVAEAENETAKAVSKGFKYSLVMINTSDSRMMRDFEKKLERRVKSVDRISFSPEESVFEVYLIGNISDLEDFVYDTAESIPGMEGILLVMQRGNSITFDTGM